MNRKELDYVLKVLDRIENPDEHIEKARAYIKKDIANYEACKGQLKDSYKSRQDW